MAYTGKGRPLSPREGGGRDLGTPTRKWGKSYVHERIVESDDTLTIEAGDSLIISPPCFKVVQFTVTHEDFSDSATSEVIEPGVTIPKGAYVLRTLYDNIVKWEGGSISDAELTVGDSDGSGGTTDPDRYMTGTPDVFQDADVLDAGAVSGTALHTSDADVAVTLNLTGDDCADLTAGSATITIFYLVGVDHS